MIHTWEELFTDIFALSSREGGVPEALLFRSHQSSAGNPTRGVAFERDERSTQNFRGAVQIRQFVFIPSHGKEPLRDAS